MKIVLIWYFQTLPSEASLLIVPSLNTKNCKNNTLFDRELVSRQIDPDKLIQTIWSRQFDPDNLIQTILISRSRWNDFTSFLFNYYCIRLLPWQVKSFFPFSYFVWYTYTDFKLLMIPPIFLSYLNCAFRIMTVCKLSLP